MSTLLAAAIAVLVGAPALVWTLLAVQTIQESRRRTRTNQRRVTERAEFWRLVAGTWSEEEEQAAEAAATEW